MRNSTLLASASLEQECARRVPSMFHSSRYIYEHITCSFLLQPLAPVLGSLMCVWSRLQPPFRFVPFWIADVCACVCVRVTWNFISFSKSINLNQGLMVESLDAPLACPIVDGGSGQPGLLGGSTPVGEGVSQAPHLYGVTLLLLQLHGYVLLFF